MTKKIQENKPSQSNVINAKRAFNRATDLAHLGVDSLGYCEALFKAIQNAENLDQAKSIANVGHYIATDHGNMFDVDREQLVNESEALV